jgi:hypothetical protein
MTDIETILQDMPCVVALKYRVKEDNDILEVSMRLKLRIIGKASPYSMFMLLSEKGVPIKRYSWNLSKGSFFGERETSLETGYMIKLKPSFEGLEHILLIKLDDRINTEQAYPIRILSAVKEYVMACTGDSLRDSA